MVGEGKEEPCVAQQSNPGSNLIRQSNTRVVGLILLKRAGTASIHICHLLSGRHGAGQFVDAKRNPQMRTHSRPEAMDEKIKL